MVSNLELTVHSACAVSGLPSSKAGPRLQIVHAPVLVGFLICLAFALPHSHLAQLFRHPMLLPVLRLRASADGNAAVDISIRLRSLAHDVRPCSPPCISIPFVFSTETRMQVSSWAAARVRRDLLGAFPRASTESGQSSNARPPCD